MRIPHVGGINPTFGQRGPDRVQPLNIDTRFVDAGQEAMGRLARTVGGIAQDVQQDRMREADALARAKAANAVLEDEVTVGAIFEDVARQHAEGNLGWQDVESEVERRLTEREPPSVQGLDPAGQEAFTGRLRANQLQIAARARTLADSGRRTEFRAQFDRSLDTLGKLAGDPSADIDKINMQAEAFAPLARQAGVDEAVISARVQAFKDRNWTNQASRRLIEARDNPEALAALEQDLTAEDGFYAGRLDAEKRNALLSNVLNARGRLENRMQVDAGRAEAAAERALGTFERSMTSTYGLPDDQLLQLRDAIASGTPEQQARFTALAQEEQTFRAVRYAAPAEQRAFIAAKEQEYAASGATALQEQNLQRMRQAAEASATLLRESPLQHMAQSTGRPVEPLNMLAFTDDPTMSQQQRDQHLGGFGTQLAERAAMLQAYRQTKGPETGTGLLLPQEAALFASALQRSSPAATASMFGQMAKALPNPSDYLSVLGQLGERAQIHAMAGAIYIESESGQAMASRILEGMDALKPRDGSQPKMKLPPASDMAMIQEVLGPAFAGNAPMLAVARQVVEAAYAGESAQEGDYSGVINTERLRKVIAGAVGTPVRINNASVLPPNGMDENDFRDALDAAWNEAAGKIQDGASTDFDSYRLRNYGSNTYRVISSNDQYVQDKEGNFLLLRVDPKFRASKPAPMPSASAATADPFGMGRLLEGQP